MDKKIYFPSLSEDVSLASSEQACFEFDSQVKILCESTQSSGEISIASEYNEQIADLIRESNDGALQQPDLSIILCYGGISNIYNGNRDGIDTNTAKQIISDFLHKPVNAQHEKSKIVGHIIEAGFVEKGSEENLIKVGSKEFEEMQDDSPYYLVFVLVLYRSVFPNFDKLLRNSSIKMSWELGFNKFAIREAKNYDPKQELLIEDTNIVISNADSSYNREAFQKLKTHLPQIKGKDKKGGDGKNPDTGLPIFRHVLSPIVPLGLAFVEKPAANLPPISFMEEEGEEDKEGSKKEQENEQNQKNNAEDNKNKQSNKDFSVEQSIVENTAESKSKQSNSLNKKKMEEFIKQISELIESKLSSLKTETSEASFSEESVASLRDMLVEATKNANTIFVEEKTKLERTIAEQSQMAETFKKSNEETKAKLEDAMRELQSMRQALAERESIEHMNYAMESLDSECSMSEDQKNVVMEDLKSMCQNGYNSSYTKEAVAAYLVKMKKLLPKKAMERSDAALDDDVALDAAKETTVTETVIATAGDAGETLVEKARRLFTVKVIQ